MDLIRTVVRQGVAPTAAGVLVGMAGAVGVTRFMQGVLFGVTPLDPLSFLAAPSLLIPVAIAASLFPALRASSMDPMMTLRAE
jgi:ABC-type lipoprotein release transport system permease subunit